MTTEVGIEQNIEILWYILSFLPRGYGALLRTVSKTFRDAVDNKCVPEYDNIISGYNWKPNLIEQFRLCCVIHILPTSRSKCLKLLRFGKEYPDTDILLLYACTIDNTSLINSICNMVQLPPKNIKICLDYAFKNTNLIIIKRLYECVEDLTIEYLLWLALSHNKPEISRWLLQKAGETRTKLSSKIKHFTYTYLHSGIESIEMINDIILGVENPYALSV